MFDGMPWSVEELRLAVKHRHLGVDREYAYFLLSGALAEIEELQNHFSRKTMPELTKDESMSIVALAEAYARYQTATKEYNAAREALDRVSRSIQAKMPWLKEATNFYEE